MKVSVIICTKDRPNDLRECLHSLAQQTHVSDEIVIVNASANQDTENICKGFQGSLPLVHIKTEPHLSRDRNIGFKNSRGDIICFIDDDCVLDRDYVRNTREVMLAGYDGCTGYDTNMRQGPLRSFFRALFMLIDLNGPGIMKASGYPSFCQMLKEKEGIECISGASSSYRRRIFDHFRFNEDLLSWGCAEDVEFSYRASQKYNFLYCPKIRYFHKRSPTSRPDKEWEFFAIVYSHYYFYFHYMKKDLFHRFCFAWANIGDLVRAAYQSVARRKIGPMRGYIRAQLAGYRLKATL